MCLPLQCWRLCRKGNHAQSPCAETLIVVLGRCDTAEVGGGYCAVELWKAKYFAELYTGMITNRSHSKGEIQFKGMLWHVFTFFFLPLNANVGLRSHRHRHHHCFQFDVAVSAELLHAMNISTSAAWRLEHRQPIACFVELSSGQMLLLKTSLQEAVAVVAVQHLLHENRNIKVLHIVREPTNCCFSLNYGAVSAVSALSACMWRLWPRVLAR